MDEKLLLNKAKRGDLAAFEALIRAYQNKIYALAFRMTRSQEDAMDVSQGAVLKIYQALPAFREESAFSTWVYRITRNTALDFLRKARPEASLDELRERGIEPVFPTESIEAHILKMDKMRAVETSIRELPEPLKTVIVLRDMDGYSYEEIAILIKVPLGTVKSRLYRAREIVRRKLREFGEEDEQKPNHDRWQ